MGDPAFIKPRLYLDPDRFAAAERSGFSGRGTGRRTSVVTSKPGWEAEIPLLTDLLRATEGLPLR